MTDDRQPVILDIDGPRNPGYLLEVLEAFAEAPRVANHLTRDHEALEYPGQADTAIRYLSSAAERTPQLLSQIGGWLEREQAAGRIGTDDGTWHAAKVTAARVRLDRAAQIAAELHEALDFAASAICHLTAVREDDDDDD